MSLEPKSVVEAYLDLLLDFTEQTPLESNNEPLIPQIADRPDVLPSMSFVAQTVTNSIRSIPYVSKLPEKPFCTLDYTRQQELQALLSPKVVAPKNVVPKVVAPKNVVPKVVAPKNVVPKVADPTVAGSWARASKAQVIEPAIPFVPNCSEANRLGIDQAAKNSKPELVESTPVAKKPKARLLLPPEPWCDNGRPIWAQTSFHALLFKVSGLTLAVPLVSLGQIYNITDKLTPLFGQADWFMGLQETPNGRIRTINTAKFVMPERYNEEFLNTAKYVVSIVGLNWGLAVDEVQQPTRLNPEDVTWRHTRTKRPWLAGTVKTAMCALLDISQMGYELEKNQG